MYLNDTSVVNNDQRAAICTSNDSKNLQIVANNLKYDENHAPRNDMVNHGANHNNSNSLHSNYHSNYPMTKYDGRQKKQVCNIVCFSYVYHI